MIEGKFIPGCGDWSAALEIRRQVFVEEQGFPPETEVDGLDAGALHLVLREGGEPVATARLTENRGEWTIGRVAVLPQHRGRGVGALAVRIAMQKARSLGAAEVRIGAQKSAEAFYAGLGFVPCGPGYIEEGVPHVPMKAPVDGSCCCCGH